MYKRCKKETYFYSTNDFRCRQEVKEQEAALYLKVIQKLQFLLCCSSGPETPLYLSSAL